jgi:hypothetical protein
MALLGCQLVNLVRSRELMKHWWPVWSLRRCFLFLVLIILLGILANGLANSTHSSIVETFVRLGVAAVTLWAFWILRWNARRVNDSPKKSK